MMLDFKRHRYSKEVILQCVYWYLRYSLSYRDIEEMMRERGIEVDHVTIYRWVIKFTPTLEETFRKQKKRHHVKSWRMDETYIKVKGQWKYLYRAVDKTGLTIDFLLTACRDHKAAKRFLTKAIQNHGTPRVINIDGSHANLSYEISI